MAFTSEKRETLITFYQACPALWNHGNDRVQRSKYFTCIDSKIVRAVWRKVYRRWHKKGWNVLLRCYRRERQAEKVTRSSGAGIDDVFDSNWESF